MKKIIRCPYCEESGVIQNLAEVMPSGEIVIQRITYNKSGQENTIITGDSFNIKCGRCNNIVFTRKTHESVNLRIGTAHRAIL